MKMRVLKKISVGYFYLVINVKVTIINEIIYGKLDSDFASKIPAMYTTPYKTECKKCKSCKCCFQVSSP